MEIKVVSLREIKEKLEKEIKEIEEEIEEFPETLDISDSEHKMRYDEFLNEIAEPVCFGELRFYPSDVLKQMDPISYVVGFRDWTDDLDEDDLRQFGEYHRLLDRKEELEEELEEIEVAIEEVETEKAMEEDDED